MIQNLVSSVVSFLCLARTLAHNKGLPILGFTYKVLKDGAVVESVGEYGIFSSTDLAQGQEIVSVNGIPVAGMDRMEFRELLSGLKAGEVTIVVLDKSSKWSTKGELIVITAQKETDSTKLGL